jgi:hypothetical protein
MQQQTCAPWLAITHIERPVFNNMAFCMIGTGERLAPGVYSHEIMLNQTWLQTDPPDASMEAPDDIFDRFVCFTGSFHYQSLSIMHCRGLTEADVVFSTSGDPSWRALRSLGRARQECVSNYLLSIDADARVCIAHILLLWGLWFYQQKVSRCLEWTAKQE